MPTKVHILTVTATYIVKHHRFGFHATNQKKQQKNFGSHRNEPIEDDVKYHDQRFELSFFPQVFCSPSKGVDVNRRHTGKVPVPAAVELRDYLESSTQKKCSYGAFE